MNVYLSSKEKIAKLGKGKEHDKEHDAKASNVFSALQRSNFLT